MEFLTRFWAGVTQRAKQFSTWTGVAFNAIALNWQSIQQQAPTMVQQLAQSNPRAASALNVAVLAIGLGLMIWNSTKGKADGQ